MLPDRRVGTVTTTTVAATVYLTRSERAHLCNELLTVMATTGRRFFSDKGAVARFEVDERGRVFFVDSYTKARIYTAYTGRWTKFSHGGTMRRLVEALVTFIRNGLPITPGYFGPWPVELCGGDLWGYGEDMVKVREAAVRLGVSQ